MGGCARLCILFVRDSACINPWKLAIQTPQFGYFYLFWSDIVIEAIKFGGDPQIKQDESFELIVTNHFVKTFELFRE